MKRYYLPIAAVVLVIALLSSCVLAVKGDVYIGYGWDTNIWDFYDTNPSILYNNIVEDSYYKSNTGTYYASYRTQYNASYYFEYDLVADYASANNFYGPYDAYFYIYLSNSGPYFYDPYYTRSLSVGNSSGKVLDKSATATSASPAMKDTLGKPTGVIEKTANGYTMHLEYWKIE